MEFSAPRPETPVRFKDGTAKVLYIRDPPEDHPEYEVKHPDGDHVPAPVFPVLFDDEKRRWTVSSTQLFETLLQARKYLKAKHDVGLVGLSVLVVPEGHGKKRTYRLVLEDHDDVPEGFPEDDG